jgi:transposase-like protein
MGSRGDGSDSESSSSSELRSESSSSSSNHSPPGTSEAETNSSKRHYTKEEKEAILDRIRKKQARGGYNQEAWCLKHGVGTASVRRWQRAEDEKHGIARKPGKVSTGRPCREVRPIVTCVAC